MKFLVDHPFCCAITGAVAVRLVLLVYGLYQDANHELKYTDIDYRVFTDAANYMSQGLSPYNRETYRYTPFLALLMLPNIWWFESFGKVLFCIFDLLTALVMFKYLRGKSSILIINFFSTIVHYLNSSRSVQNGFFNWCQVCLHLAFQPFDFDNFNSWKCRIDHGFLTDVRFVFGRN